MRLIRGAPGAGKTSLVFREFKEAHNTGAANLRIVVPTATLVRHFQHELARDGMVFSPRAVLSLNRFIAERAAPFQLVPEGLLRVIVADCLRRLRFPEFAAVAGTEGMVATIVDTIAVFDNAAATPDRLASLRKLGTHAKPFEKLWRAVDESVRSAGFLMRGDLIRKAGASGAPVRLWMDGFLAFSPIERELVASLARTCDLTITIDDGPAADDIRRFALQLGAGERLLQGRARRPSTALFHASTPERETDEIARRIVALRDRGTPFREIGVALRDTDNYVPLLKGTFERFGIPARFYFGVPLRRHPAAIFLGGLITGALNDWDFEATVEALRSHPGWGSSPEFDRFDFAVREAMPGHGAEALLAHCEHQRLRDRLAACLRIDSWPEQKRTAAEWQRLFESFAASVYRPDIPAAPGDRMQVEVARSHVAALHAWLGAVASVASIGEEAISLEQFWRAAAIAINAAVVHSVYDRADVVHVMNVFEARQWDVAALFVCGLTDRDFPRHQTPNLLFPEADLDRLRAAGIQLRRASDHEREEGWLFESLRSRASSSVILSYPDHDSAGRSLQCSRLLGSELTPEQARLCTPIPAVEPTHPAISGRIESSLLQAGMADLHRSISLTALEDLAQCRFKFFSGRTLALKGPPEPPGKRLQPRVTGSILHAALELWLAADKNRDFVEIFEAAFDEACRTEHLPPGYRLEVERIRFREIARRVSANDLWKPDSSQAEVALAIDFPGGVQVKCRIDRIDRFGNDCVIVDYKSSKTENVEKLVASRTRLQGPLYALAVETNLHLNPVAMIYWAVREDERYGWGKIPGVDLEFQPMPERWAALAKERTIERLSGFLNGDVHAQPEEPVDCRWCDFKAACRVEQQELVTIERVLSA